MKEMNLCNGCFYAGVADGFRPECNCRARYEEIEEQEETMAVGEFLKTAKTDYQRHSERLERRISRKRANKKASTAVMAVEAKYQKLSGNATNSEEERLGKKCKNAVKKAKRNKQATVIITFPTSIEKISIRRFPGQCIEKLERFFSDVACNPEIATECEEAIEILKIAKLYDGDVVAVHKEKNEICMTIGFYNKEDLSNFKRKTGKAS